MSKQKLCHECGGAKSQFTDLLCVARLNYTRVVVVEGLGDFPVFVRNERPCLAYTNDCKM